MACTNGHTIQFLLNAFQYVLSSLSLGLEPSMIAMDDRKTKRFVDAKTIWSVATRAAISRFLFGRTILVWRNLNQVVAAGPKITIDFISDWKPWRRRRQVHTTTVKSHPSSACEIVLLQTPLLHQLLCQRIASCEKDSSRHALRKQRARRQLHLIPACLAH